MANISILSRKTFKTSSGLKNNMRRSFITARMLERKSLVDRKKLIKLRRETFITLLKSSKVKENKNKNLGGILGGALGLRGLRSITRRRGGGGSAIVTPRRTPKFPGGANRFTGGGLLRNVGKSKFARGVGRVGPLAVLGTALDFSSRVQSGQNTGQAIVGSGAGLAGALAGGAKGAAIGSVAGPVGTIVGGILGSVVGGGLASGAADFLTGANKRRQFETERFQLIQAKTKFSEAQDQLDRVLDKLSRNRLLGAGQVARADGEEDLIPSPVPFLNFPKEKSRVRKVLDSDPVKTIGYTALGLGLTTLAILSIFNVFDGAAGEVVFSSAAVKFFSKVPLLKKMLPFLNRALSKKSTVKVFAKFDRAKGVNVGKRLLTDRSKTNITKSRLQPRKILRSQDKVTFSDKADLTQTRDLFKPKPNEKQILRKIIKKINKEGGIGQGDSVPIKNPIKKRTTRQLDLFKNKRNIEKKFAGGDVEKGMAYIVGDAEGGRTGFEELFVPDESGTIIPSEILNKTKDKIIVLTQKGDQVSVPVPVETSSGGGSAPQISAFAKVAKYAQFTSLLTV